MMCAQRALISSSFVNQRIILIIRGLGESCTGILGELIQRVNGWRKE
jgi:hypothetical protein